MSAYGSKVIAVLDTQSAFGITNGMRDSINTLKQDRFNALLQPQNPVEGQLWFDKVNLQLQIYISDDNSSQW